MAFEIWNGGRRVGLFEGADSVQWLILSRDAGEINITLQDPALADKLTAPGALLLNTDTGGTASICYDSRKQDKTSRQITLRGYTAEKFLDERVVMATVQIKNIEAGMRQIYADNRRGLSIEQGPDNAFPETTDAQITWGTILEAYKDLADAAGFGFRVVFDRATATNTLHIFKGTDRSDQTKPEYHGFFGDEAGNIDSIAYTVDKSTAKNVAIVGGEGEGADRVVRIVGSAEGDARRELWVDAKDIQRKYQIATPTGKLDDQGNPIYEYTDGTYTDDEYNALLDARGLEKLLETLNEQTVECTVSPCSLVYDLEDRVPVVCKQFLQIRMSARISGIKYVYENGQRQTVPLLSDFRAIE